MKKGEELKPHVQKCPSCRSKSTKIIDQDISAVVFECGYRFTKFFDKDTKY